MRFLGVYSLISSSSGLGAWKSATQRLIISSEMWNVPCDDRVFLAASRRISSSSGTSRKCTSLLAPSSFARERKSSLSCRAQKPKSRITFPPNASTRAATSHNSVSSAVWRAHRARAGPHPDRRGARATHRASGEVRIARSRVFAQAWSSPSMEAQPSDEESAQLPTDRCCPSDPGITEDHGGSRRRTPDQVGATAISTAARAIIQDRRLRPLGHLSAVEPRGESTV
jgi:hypothetical protein